MSMRCIAAADRAERAAAAAAAAAAGQEGPPPGGPPPLLPAVVQPGAHQQQPQQQQQQKQQQQQEARRQGMQGDGLEEQQARPRERARLHSTDVPGGGAQLGPAPSKQAHDRDQADAPDRQAANGGGDEGFPRVRLARAAESGELVHRCGPLAAMRERGYLRRKAHVMLQAHATQVKDDQENNRAISNSQGGSGTHNAKRRRTGEGQAVSGQRCKDRRVPGLLEDLEDQRLAPDDGPIEVARKTHASIQIGIKLMQAEMHTQHDLLRHGIELLTNLVRCQGRQGAGTAGSAQSGVP
ncbi:hypothetical protein D9Q98_003123 [Chlorella vulgaris]|uniref:Uncharacterized protein n=1 Tax=Chlorella vulgaris TaxID=3077 RepID=A0A9D4TSE7_CHLVU|nr:hypothetical protein D9Q98_003123 [Chlorella vulgaris]